MVQPCNRTLLCWPTCGIGSRMRASLRARRWKAPVTRSPRCRIMAWTVESAGRLACFAVKPAAAKAPQGHTSTCRDVLMALTDPVTRRPMKNCV